jgi:hypothetical protein
VAQTEMIYNLSDQYQYEQYKRRCNYLAKKKRLVEIIDKSTRTIDQNSYLHLIIAYFASETGNTLETVKQEFFKGYANEVIFGKRKRSTASLNIEEMSLAIERFKIWASMVGNVYLPDAENQEQMRQLQSEIQRNKQYL